MNALALLGLAIASEVLATLALKASDGFTRPGPMVLVMCGYALAFVALAQSLREIPVGIAYAAWAGIGTAGVALAGWWIYGETLALPAIVGVALIVAGAGVLGFNWEVH